MNLSEFYRYFQQSFGLSAGTLLFLSSIYAEFSSLFVETHLYMDQPLGLLVEGQAIFSKIIQLLRVDVLLEPLPLNDIASIQRHIRRYGDDFLPLSYHPGIRAEKNLNSLLEDFSNGRCGACPVLTLPIIGFTKIAPSAYSDGLLLVKPEIDCKNMPEEQCFRQWYSYLETRARDKASVINEPLVKFSKSSLSFKDHAWLFAAIQVACALTDDLAGDTDFFHTLEADLSVALDVSENLADNTGIADLFIDALYEHGAMPSARMLERSETEKFDHSELEKFPLFDAVNYYYSDPLFSKICQKLADVSGFDQINQALSDNEIQEFEQGLTRITYTKKITVRLPSGIERKRYHVLKRSLIDRDGSADLVDVYNGRKEGALANNGTDISW